jgi:hypothetical protein
MQRFGKQFSAESCSIPNEKPDRYAAAICIRVRPDGFVARIFCWRKLPPVRAAKGGTDLRRYPDCMRFRRTDSYFFFFLAVFFAFFAFFAFLAMFPSVSREFAQCKSTIDLRTFRIHHNYKI